MAKYGAFELINSSILDKRTLNILLGYIAMCNHRIWRATFLKDKVTILEKGKEIFTVSTRGNTELRQLLTCAYTNDKKDFDIKLTAVPGQVVFAIAKNNNNSSLIAQLYIDRVYGSYSQNQVYFDCHDIRGDKLEGIAQESVFLNYANAVKAMNMNITTLAEFKKFAKKHNTYRYKCEFGYKFNDEADMDVLDDLKENKSVIGLKTKAVDIRFDITEKQFKSDEFYARAYMLGNFLHGKNQKYLHHATKIKIDSIGIKGNPVMSINNKELNMISSSIKSAMFIEPIEQ